MFSVLDGFKEKGFGFMESGIIRSIIKEDVRRALLNGAVQEVFRIGRLAGNICKAENIWFEAFR